MIVVGVAGGSGSGKTTLARTLHERLGTHRTRALAHDDYYRPLTPAQRAAVATHNFDEPAALETTLLVDHLRALRDGRPVDVPTYAFDVHDRVGHRRVEPAEVVLLDGILLLTEPALREVLDLAVFVDAPADVRLARRLARDVAERGRTPESVRDQFARHVEPMHQRHVAPSRDHAHLVVDGTQDIEAAVARILARLTSLRG